MNNEETESYNSELDLTLSALTELPGVKTPMAILLSELHLPSQEKRVSKAKPSVLTLRPHTGHISYFLVQNS